MFYLVFGVIWTILSLCVIVPFYHPDFNGVLEINGREVDYIEFTQMLWPKIIFAFVIGLGLVIMAVGIYIVYRDYRTNKHGKKTYGMVVNVEPNGMFVNEVEQYDVLMLTLEENGECNIYHENIGCLYDDYLPGEYYEVLHYKKDINILNPIDPALIPQDKLDIIKNASFINPNVPTFFEPTEVVIDNLKDDKNKN